VSRAVGWLFSKDAAPPFISERYQHSINQTAREQRDFPYDVSFLPAVQIHALVAHSVQYRVTDAVFGVAKNIELPASILKELSAFQHARQEGEFRVKGWFTKQAFLQAVERVTEQEFIEQHQSALLDAAQRFPRCETAVWTPGRGYAALSEDMRLKRAAASAFLWEKWQEMQELGKELSIAQLKLWRDIEMIQDTLTVPAWFVDSLHLEGTSDERRDHAQETWNRRLGESTIHDLHQQMRVTMHEIQNSLTTTD